ncbi:MAG: Ig-like domain-containing protein [Nanoarchaeota archaeon]
MKTRWIANIIFVAAILGSLLTIYELGNISGRVVNVIPTSGQCGETYYEALWESIFRAEYVGGNVVKGFKGGTTPSGNCVDFDLYNDTKLVGSHLIYFINHNSSRDPSYFAGIISINDLNGNWVINNTYELRNKFYESLFGVKNRASFISGLAGAVQTVNANLKQDVSITNNWDSSNSDYHIYREAETTKLNGAYLNKNISIAVYKQKEAILYYYKSEVITPMLDFVINIPNINNVEDNTSINVFDLDDHFSTNVPIKYILDSSDIVNMSIDNLNKVNLSFKKDWNGKINVSIYGLYNNVFLNSSNNITVAIAGVNDRPMLKNNYPTVISWKKNNDKILDMGDFFYDAEGDALSYNITGNDKIDAEIDDEDNEIRLTPDMDFIGIETIKLKATDNGGLNVETGNIKLNVSSEGSSSGGTTGTTLPSGNVQIISKSPVSVVLNINTGESEVFLVDATGENTLSYIWTVNGVNQNNPSESFAFTGSNTGSYVVKVDVSDGVQSTSASWTIAVQSGQGVTSSTTLPTTATTTLPGNYDEIPVVEGPNYLLIYIIAGSVIIIGLGVAVYFVIKSMKKKPKKEEYEVIRSNEEIGMQGSNLGVVDLGRINPVINFIKDFRSKGFGDDVIRNALLKKGWSNEDINTAFKNA